MRIPRPGPGAVLPAALLLGFLSICLVANLLTGASAQNPPANTQATTAHFKRPEFVPGELLVRFRPGTAIARNKSKASMSVAAAGRTVRVEVNHFGGSDLVDGLMLARVAPADTGAALKALRARADVVYVEPNYIRHADAVPNDPRFNELFALHDGPVGGPAISAESAWNTTTGSNNVVVGVIDSGMDIEHRDLKDNIFINPGEIPGNNLDDDNNGFIDDVSGWDFANDDRTVFDDPKDDAHGTHVAGTIGARGNNSIGVVGVNWNVQIMPLKALFPTFATDSDLLDAYNYAKLMKQRGVNLRVLNNSYGGQEFSQSLLAGIKELGDVGILFVAAAGNESLTTDFLPHFPASFDLPNVISVAASTEVGSLAQFSNRGPQSVHLAAPGQLILSTTPRGFVDGTVVPEFTEPDGSTYSRFAGTSMASPHVAGVAALACAADPSITLEKLRAAVLFSVDEHPNFTNMVMTGGRLNANKTLQSALENDSIAPAAPGNFRINAQNGLRLELRWTEAGDDGTTGRASLDEIRFTDSSSGKQFRLSSTRALDPGSERTVFVSIPIKHPNGQLTLRTFDNVGNTSTATVNVSIAADVADPYTVALSAPGALTAQNSGIPVGPRGDNITAVTPITLPFPFPFFGFTTNTVVPSSNGALYIPIPPDFALPHSPLPTLEVPADFGFPTSSNLEGLAMVAGMWANLRTDVNPTDNVYMVEPDPDRVIFRWQGVPVQSVTPINFEIELRRDGTIQTRYGNGNTNLTPVIVGISGGDPEAYLIETHSSEMAPLSLTMAQTVTFALRNPPPPPTSDLEVTMTASPNPVIAGQNVSYTVSVKNLGPSTTVDLVMTDVLPAGTTFVSCTPIFGSATCTGPPVGSTGTVTGRLSQSAPAGSINVFTIVAKVTGAPGASLQNTASATSFRPDPNTSNNSASVTSFVVAESFFSGARAVAAGRSHTSSIRTDGTVWVWGTGQNGQLGDGNTGIGVRALTPVQVGGLEGITAIADGNGSVHAVKQDGTVWSWGSNNLGQLGDGTTTDRSHPIQTNGLTSVKAVDTGDFYVAAVKTDGTVWHWGASNSLISNNFGFITTPAQLQGITNVTAIAAGGNHLLLLKNDKTVWAIGANSLGQLGDGATTNQHSPVQVSGLSNVVRIAAGAEFSMALKEDGSVWAWGLNRNGQLGPDGGSNDFSPHPNAVKVTGFSTVITEISAGQEFCLALANNGTIWSWGNNSNGQLGQGPDFITNSTPQQIPNFSNVAAIAAGMNHSVALKTDGSVWAWGANTEGEIGDTSTTKRVAPARVIGLETVSSPSFNPPPGTFAFAVDVTITCATPGATIHFTTNGNEPTESDPVVASGGTVRLNSFTFLRARAWKPGLVPSSTTFGQYDVQPVPPELLVDTNDPNPNQLGAVDSMLLLRDPFAVINTENPMRNLNDPNTRVMLFVKHLQLLQGETAAAVVVNLTDANGGVHNIPAEDVRTVPNFLFAQVIFRLPNNLPTGTCQVKLSAHNMTSNVGSIRIKP